MPDYPFNFVNSSTSGNAPTDPFITHFETRDPTPLDVNYPIQKRWINKTFDSEWILEGFSSAGGVVTAIWSKIAGGTKIVETLTGNTGGPVGTDGSNNINVVGDVTTINIVGNPATHTLTASTGGSVATSYVENVGTATPSGGILNVLGGTAIATAGAGNTITINAAGSVATTYTENAGTATPSGNNLNVLGGTGITTAGAGSTITINAAGSVATTYVEDSGSAVPALNILNIVGSGGITTSGAGNTVTINGTSSGSVKQWLFFTDSGTLFQTTNTMPFLTVPQSTDGAEVMTGTITPTNAGSRLIVRFHCQSFIDVANGNINITAIFRDAGASAVAAMGTSAVELDSMDNVIVYQVVAGSTAATTFKVRAGPQVGGAGTLIINGGYVAGAPPAVKFLGAALFSTLEIIELNP